MKVSQSVRKIYASQSERSKLLQQTVDRLLEANKEKSWFYYSRVKEEISFALKLETGRFPDLDNLEDFFACTLVVENKNSIEKAKSLVEHHFEVLGKRPKRDNFTHKSPYSFEFDDLRFYVTLKNDPALPPSGLSHVKFEIQVKTFLQHAWSVSTRELAYKTDSISWAKSRIAYQIKAMLEHIEISIQEAEKLSHNLDLKKDNKHTESLNKVVKLLKKYWQPEDLPSDIIRLAENIKSFNQALGLSLNDLKSILERETKEGRGTQTLNLSPYSIIIQSVVHQKQENLRNFLSDQSKSSQGFKIFIPEELELPEDLLALALQYIDRVVFANSASRPIDTENP